MKSSSKSIWIAIGITLIVLVSSFLISYYVSNPSVTQKDSEYLASCGGDNIACLIHYAGIYNKPETCDLPILKNTPGTNWADACLRDVSITNANEYLCSNISDSQSINFCKQGVLKIKGYNTTLPFLLSIFVLSMVLLFAIKKTKNNIIALCIPISFIPSLIIIFSSSQFLNLYNAYDSLFVYRPISKLLPAVFF